MISVFIGVALKVAELILDRIIQNKEAKKRAAKWLENLQSKHLQTSSKLSNEYKRLIEKYHGEKES